MAGPCLSWSETEFSRRFSEKEGLPHVPGGPSAATTAVSTSGPPREASGSVWRQRFPGDRSADGPVPTWPQSQTEPAPTPSARDFDLPPASISESRSASGAPSPRRPEQGARVPSEGRPAPRGPECPGPALGEQLPGSAGTEEKHLRADATTRKGQRCGGQRGAPSPSAVWGAGRGPAAAAAGSPGARPATSGNWRVSVGWASRGRHGGGPPTRPAARA